MNRESVNEVWSPCPGALSHAYPATLHDLSLEVLRGHNQDLDSLHEARTGTKDPRERKKRSGTQNRDQEQ